MNYSIIADAYEKIAYSDATGGDSDSNRYISTDPQYYYESTHIYEFTIAEDPNEIDIIDILWEGYADYCTQMELYIWDYVVDQWCDGHGYYGQNRFMDNWAGNEEGFLESQIISDFNQYIDENGISAPWQLQCVR